MYLHGAVMNAKQCREFFPDWKVRIYHNDSVSDELLGTLRELGVETVRVDPKGTYGTFWRFRPLFEPGYEHVLVRDIDSRITWRDVRCVNEWLESGKKFLNIRDHPSHYDWPIIAGMFGVRTGALPLTLVPIMEQYALIHQYVSDQVFGSTRLGLYETGCLRTWIQGTTMDVRIMDSCQSHESRI